MKTGNGQIKEVTNLVARILSELPSFGLDPADWNIERISGQRFEEVSFHHRSDDDVRLHGRLSWRLGKVRLKELAFSTVD